MRESSAYNHIAVSLGNSEEFIRVLESILQLTSLQKCHIKVFLDRIWQEPIMKDDLINVQDPAIKQKLIKLIYDVLCAYKPILSKNTDARITHYYLHTNQSEFYKLFPTARERISRKRWLIDTLEKYAISFKRDSNIVFIDNLRVLKNY